MASHFCILIKSYNMKTLTITKDSRYSSPRASVIRIDSESLICTSPDNNMADGEDNTGSAPGFPFDD